MRLTGSVESAAPAEVRIRVVGCTDSMADAKRIGNEVETLYTNGPAAAAARGNRREGGRGGFDARSAGAVRPHVSYEVA